MLDSWHWVHHPETKDKREGRRLLSKPLFEPGTCWSPSPMPSLLSHSASGGGAVLLAQSLIHWQGRAVAFFSFFFLSVLFRLPFCVQESLQSSDQHQTFVFCDACAPVELQGWGVCISSHPEIKKQTFVYTMLACTAYNCYGVIPQQLVFCYCVKQWCPLFKQKWYNSQICYFIPK